MDSLSPVAFWFVSDHQPVSSPRGHPRGRGDLGCRVTKQDWGGWGISAGGDSDTVQNIINSCEGLSQYAAQQGGCSGPGALHKQSQ